MRKNEKNYNWKDYLLAFGPILLLSIFVNMTPDARLERNHQSYFKGQLPTTKVEGLLAWVYEYYYFSNRKKIVVRAISAKVPDNAPFVNDFENVLEKFFAHKDYTLKRYNSRHALGR